MLAEFKESLQSFISHIITEQGSLPPVGAVLLHDKSTDNMELGFIPVPTELMNSQEGKDTLAESVFPSVFTTMEHGNFKEIFAFGFASEIWIRETPKPVMEDNWKDLPKREGVMIHIETKDLSDVIIKVIKRDGNVVTPEGKMIDNIILEDHPGYKGLINATTSSSEGRFSHILRNYHKAKN